MLMLRAVASILPPSLPHAHAHAHAHVDLLPSHMPLPCMHAACACVDLLPSHLRLPHMHTCMHASEIPLPCADDGLFAALEARSLHKEIILLLGSADLMLIPLLQVRGKANGERGAWGERLALGDEVKWLAGPHAHPAAAGTREGKWVEGRMGGETCTGGRG